MNNSNAVNTVRTVSLERFKGAVGLIPTFSCRWGNTRKANIDRVTLKGNGEAETAPGDDAAKEQKAKTRMQLKKQLIVSKEYDAIRSFQAEIRGWIYTQTVPSFIREGFQLASLSAVEVIEKRLRKAVKEELPALVEKFIAVYPGQIEEARKVLEPVGQFNIMEYPSAAEMRGMFGVSWNWIAFTVPDGLPAELRQAEEEKLKRQFEDAGQEIIQALRKSFSDLITHATEKLTVQPGEKPKVFRDSLIGNIADFIETFNQRNLLGDVELAQMVSRAKDVLLGVTPQKLRDYDAIKEKTRTEFEKIKAELSGMVMEKPARQFDFEDSEQPEANPAPTSASQADGAPSVPDAAPVPA